MYTYPFVVIDTTLNLLLKKHFIYKGVKYGLHGKEITFLIVYYIPVFANYFDVLARILNSSDSPS
jgi:hypothetical protein